MKTFFTYILASKSRVIYIGVTNDLERHMREHLTKKADGFTAKYNVNRLVWYETFRDIRDAIAAEKKLKGWTRKKKTDLIEASNQDWLDLSEPWTALADLRWEARYGVKPKNRPALLIPPTNTSALSAPGPSEYLRMTTREEQPESNEQNVNSID